MRLKKIITVSALCSLMYAPAYAEAWRANNVQWQVSRHTDQASGEDACEIFWVYDDTVGVSFSHDDQNRFYYILELPEGGNAFPEIQKGVSYEGWLIGRDKTEVPLYIQGVSSSQALMLVGPEASSLEYLKKSARILVNLGGNVLELPLENSLENFSVFKDCYGSLSGVDIESANVAPAAPISDVAEPVQVVHSAANTAQQMEARMYQAPRAEVREKAQVLSSSVEIAPEFAKALSKNNIDGADGVIKLVPPSGGGASPVSSSIEISPEFAPLESGANVGGASKVSPTEPIQLKAPEVAPQVSDKPAFKPFEGEIPQSAPSPAPTPAMTSPMSYEDAKPASAAIQDMIAKPEPAHVPVQPLEARVQNAKAVVPTKQNDQMIQQTRYVDDTRGQAACAPVPSQTMDSYKKDLENAPVLDNLMRKLALLEREKEELRKKLLSVTHEGYIADIVACEPAGGKEDQEVSDTIIQQFEVTVDRLREENQQLLAQIGDENGDISQAREENDALHQQVTELTRRNQDLQSEVYSYREQLEEINTFLEADESAAEEGEIEDQVDSGEENFEEDEELESESESAIAADPIFDSTSESSEN